MPTNKASGDGSTVELYLTLCLLLGDKQLYIKGIRKGTGPSGSPAIFGAKGNIENINQLVCDIVLC